ncbi:MAG: hypothetical protein ABSC23_07145 [Bryobacteraceae bacterium]|jgi:hypothetical protein
MALALDKSLSPAPAYPEQAPNWEDSQKLDLAVVFTSIESTLRALREAETLAERLAARITLVVPQIVPYPLPLESPPVLLRFNERRFFEMASRSRVETRVRIYLCRDRWDALEIALRPHSLVVMGGGKRWWPAPEARLARRLRRAGHEVIVVEAG